MVDLEVKTDFKKYRSGSHVGKWRTLKLEQILKVPRWWPYWKMADVNVKLAFIQNNNRRHTVCNN